jgi:hypothetical protein
LSGTDKKGNKISVSSESKFSKYHLIYKNELLMEGSEENPISITNIEVITMYSDNTKDSESQSIFGNNKKTSFAVLLNGYKKPSKYGQCMVFSKSSSEDCNFIKLDSFTTVQSAAYNKEKNTTTVRLRINPESKQEKKNLNALTAWGMIDIGASVVFKTANGKKRTETLFQAWDNELEQYYLMTEFNVDGNEISSLEEVILICSDIINNETPEEIRARFINEKTSTSGNVTTTDGLWAPVLKEKTKEKYVISKGYIELSKTSNITTISTNFALKAGSSIPTKLTINLEIIGCDNTKSYIDIKLNYDSKTGVFSGTSLFDINGKCDYTIGGFTATVTNSCGYTYTSQKNNGYIDDKNVKWVCQDECLKIKTDEDTVCGNTDHF